MGTTPEEKILKEIAEDAMNFTGIEAIESPDGVEIVERGSAEEKVKFIINHNSVNTKYGDIILAPFEVKAVSEN